MERSVRTFCRVCEPACGLVARVEDGEITRLAPDRDHPVTKGFACHKGIAALDIHRDPDRLARPQRRTADGGFEDLSWDEAASGVAAEIERIRDAHGPDAVGFYLGNPLAFNSLASPATGSLIAQLGTERVFSSGTQDCANKFAGSESVFGTSTLHPVPDIEHTDCLLVFGSNPRASKMSFLSIADPVGRLREAGRRGAKVWFVNPRRVEPDEAGVGETIWIRPDTDLYLMAAMLCEIDRSVGFREDVLRDHARGVDELRSFVGRYPPERVEGVTGIPAERIRELAREFAQAPSAAVYMSTGVNMGRQGTLAYWLLFMLSLVTGNLDRRGGNLYSLGFYPAAKAGRAKPPQYDVATGGKGPTHRSRGPLPGNLLADTILQEENPLRALVVVAGNPLLSIGGESRLREAFERLELLVCVDLYRNATGELAHFLLPATDMLERRDVTFAGLGLQHEPYVQYTDAVVAPRDERREEWWILGRIEQELGLRSVLDAGDDPPLFGRLDHMMSSVGLSTEKLRETGGVARLPEKEPGRFFSDWIQTEDRRVDCCPKAFQEIGALDRAEEIFLELASAPPDQLRLITRRDTRMHNSWYQNVERFRRGRHGQNPLHVSPEDARTRGLSEGDLVRITGPGGAIEAPVTLDDELMPGVVAMAHGWGNAGSTGLRTAARHPGVNPNRLLPSGPGSFEPLSNQAFMTGIPVGVEPAA